MSRAGRASNKRPDRVLNFDRTDQVGGERDDGAAGKRWRDETIKVVHGTTLIREG